MSELYYQFGGNKAGSENLKAINTFVNNAITELKLGKNNPNGFNILKVFQQIKDHIKNDKEQPEDASVNKEKAYELMSEYLEKNINDTIVKEEMLALLGDHIDDHMDYYNSHTTSEDILKHIRNMNLRTDGNRKVFGDGEKQKAYEKIDKFFTIKKKFDEIMELRNMNFIINNEIHVVYNNENNTSSKLLKELNELLKLIDNSSSNGSWTENQVRNYLKELEQKYNDYHTALNQDFITHINEKFTSENNRKNAYNSIIQLVKKVTNNNNKERIEFNNRILNNMKKRGGNPYYYKYLKYKKLYMQLKSAN